MPAPFVKSTMAVLGLRLPASESTGTLGGFVLSTRDSALYHRHYEFLWSSATSPALKPCGRRQRKPQSRRRQEMGLLA
jgi:hypothetical protein